MLDTTLYQLGRALEESGRVTEAVVYYAQVAEEFPFSDYYDAVTERLILLEQPVPEVDEQAAAQRSANLRDEGSFNPIKSVWQVFSGRPDIYEIARKRAEERELAGEGLPPGSGSSANVSNP